MNDINLVSYKPGGGILRTSIKKTYTILNTIGTMRKNGRIYIPEKVKVDKKTVKFYVRDKKSGKRKWLTVKTKECFIGNTQ